jgi:hypothetical protein
VLRRISPTGEEMAWAPPDAATPGRAWLSLTADSKGEYQFLAPSEEVLPLCPTTFTERGRRRRMLVGLIPTASRETFQAAPLLSPFATTPDIEDPRLQDFETRVTGPLTELRSALPATEPDPIRNEREKAEQEASQFVLLDCASLIATTLAPLWQAMEAGSAPSQPELAILYATFGNTIDTSQTGAPIWRDAMQTAWQ